MWNASVSATAARFDMALRTQSRGCFEATLRSPGLARARARAGAAPTAADSLWPAAAVFLNTRAESAPNHMPTATIKLAATASTTRPMPAPRGCLVFGAASRGARSSNRSSTGRSPNRGGRGTVLGACHSNRSTTAPRTFSQWKSGGMNPGSGMPGATRNPAGAAGTLNGPGTAVLGAALPNSAPATDRRASLAIASTAGQGIQVSLASGRSCGAAARPSASLRRSPFLGGAEPRNSPVSLPQYNRDTAFLGTRWPDYIVEQIPKLSRISIDLVNVARLSKVNFAPAHRRRREFFTAETQRRREEQREIP